MQERRKTQRSRTYLGGQIVFNKRMPTYDCLVRNMSRDGAKIDIPSKAAVPKEFDIMIHHNDESCRAQIIWRNEVEAGIAFSDRKSAAVVSIESARRITQLESERKTLARRVAQLSEPA